jgi:hypothetical protein
MVSSSNFDIQTFLPKMNSCLLYASNIDENYLHFSDHVQNDDICDINFIRVMAIRLDLAIEVMMNLFCEAILPSIMMTFDEHERAVDMVVNDGK